MLTSEELKGLLHYDPESGIFTWIVGFRKGQKAGFVLNNRISRRWCIKINQTVYRASRLAWLYMTGDWPSVLIDHKDGNSLNDSFANLREADHSQNSCNRKLPENNTSGHKNIRCIQGKGWQVAIMKNGQSETLTFHSLAQAIEARDNLLDLFHEEFARTK